MNMVIFHDFPSFFVDFPIEHGDFLSFFCQRLPGMRFFFQRDVTCPAFVGFHGRSAAWTMYTCIPMIGG